MFFFLPPSSSCSSCLLLFIISQGEKVRGPGKIAQCTDVSFLVSVFHFISYLIVPSLCLLFVSSCYPGLVSKILFYLSGFCLRRSFSCFRFSFLGKRKHTTPCSSAELFFAKKVGPQRQDFGGRYGFLGFYRVFASTTGLESFALRPEKFPKWFSFGGGRVRFLVLRLLLLVVVVGVADDNVVVIVAVNICLYCASSSCCC